MEDKKTSNVIKFPVENRRADMSNIPTEPEEIIDKIELIKRSYFSDVSDRILDDVLRSIDVLGLEYSKFDTFDMTSNDHILIKESIISAMCRIVGIDHPLHAIGDTEIVQHIDVEFDDSTVHSYRFRSEKDRNEPEAVEV